ncbi:heterokaryon incompatibility protein [Botrytis cinerea]
MQDENYVFGGQVYGRLYCFILLLGSSPEKSVIWIDNVRVSVGVNLANALIRLRRMGIKLVWTDAVCIKQSDNQEKSFQVRLMTQIYSKAKIVYTWLGLDSRGLSAFATNSMKDLALSNPHRIDSLFSRASRLRLSSSLNYSVCYRCNIPGCKELTVSLRDFFNCEYWARMWIIQEIAVASDVRFLCGDTASITYDQLAIAIKFLRNELKCWGGEVASAASNYRRVANIRNIYQKRNLDLRRAMALAKDSECGWPQDRVYALEILCDLTMAFARQDGCFDVMLTSSDKYRSQDLRLPSWTPNWISTSSWKSHMHVLERAKNIQRPANVDFGDEIRRLHTQSFDGKMLSLMGTQLDTVQDTAWMTNSQISLTSGYGLQQPDHSRVGKPNYSKAQILNSLSVCFLQEDFKRKDEAITRLLWYAFYCVQMKNIPNGRMPPRDIESQSKHASKPLLIHGKSLDQWALYSKKEIWKKRHFNWYFRHRKLTYSLIVLMGVAAIVLFAPRYNLKSDALGIIKLIWGILLFFLLIAVLLVGGYAMKNRYASLFSFDDDEAKILGAFCNTMNLVNSFMFLGETLKVTVSRRDSYVSRAAFNSKFKAYRYKYEDASEARRDARTEENEVAIQRAAQQVKDRVYEEAHAQKRRTKKASLECNRQDLINAAQNKATEERANMKRKEKHRSRRDVALTAIYTTHGKTSRATKKRDRDAEE